MNARRIERTFSFAMTGVGTAVAIAALAKGYPWWISIWPILAAVLSITVYVTGIRNARWHRIVESQDRTIATWRKVAEDWQQIAADRGAFNSVVSCLDRGKS